MVPLEVWRVNNLRDTENVEKIPFLMCSLDFLALFFPAQSLAKMSEPQDSFKTSGINSGRGNGTGEGNNKFMYFNWQFQVTRHFKGETNFNQKMFLIVNC